MSLEGQRLGEFEILERLGQGGMGAVYKARQVSLDRLVALKTLQASLAGDPEYIARFVHEAKAAAALNHPNLVQVYSAGETDGLHWFAMEYVEGESAQDRVKRKGRLDPAEAIAIGVHIATALEYGWRKAHLIHRDIKPDNIFLSSDGEVKLGDLGLAKNAGQTLGLTMTGASMGTPHYFSPEQAEGKKDVDLRADIYSLGCTIFHLVAGKPPYSGDSAFAVMMMHVNAPVPSPQHVWPGFPGELARVVMKMMAKSPAARQQTYEEVIADLRRAYDALTGETVPMGVAVTQQRQSAIVTNPEPTAQKSKSKAPLLAALATVIAVLGAVAWFAFGKKEPQQAEPAAPVGPATTLPATATKDTPFVNSLGMQFVPVPIKGGPGAGQRVLFGVWDVRVQDYAVYAKAQESAGKGVDGSWKTQQRDGVSAGRELDHPVVGVSWEDAQAFCKWLTEKESAEGKLPKGWKYRLPSDEEWSWAAGMPPELGATPEEKGGKNSVDFPWGKDYPPTKKVGNYADETFHAKFPKDTKDKVKDQPWFRGYTDGYATTSPVGSFPANAYGLYDLGGNAWQWCEDWLNADHKDRVTRGASWANFDRITVMASSRGRNEPGYRSANVGFRCVLAPATSAPDAAAAKADLPNPAGAVLAAATKDKPFVNTLGMKFVPVPIVSGPTAGQRVLFGVWDVRVQDYAVYAGAKKVDDSWTKEEWDGVPVGRELNHPVVGVSWEDAQGFCQWLTEKESAEGKLPKVLKYRLPSDEEWSWAAGLPPEAGTTPAEKSGKNSVDFPWGKDWPPTKKVGNYADETFHGKFPKDYSDKKMNQPWMAGYNDGYATTSPVGSFPANAYGLYDMGGNVWQWCEDWHDSSHKDRVLRGASWAFNQRGFLLSSARTHNAPGRRDLSHGFRCVLGESPR